MNPTRLLQYAIVVITVIGIYSCRKAFLPHDEMQDQKASWAKQYYNDVLQKNQGNQVFYKKSLKTAAVEAITNTPNMKTPMWVRARYDKTALFDFVEVPLIYTRKISTRIGPKGSEADAQTLKASFDRLIIYKDKDGKIDQRIISFIPDKEYAARHNGDISHNKINQLDKDFDGYLRYKTWDGKHLFTLQINLDTRYLIPIFEHELPFPLLL